MKDREAWPDAVHGVAKNWTRLSEQQQNQGITCENPGLKDLEGEKGQESQLLTSPPMDKSHLWTQLPAAFECSSLTFEWGTKNL